MIPLPAATLAAQAGTAGGLVLAAGAAAAMLVLAYAMLGRGVAASRRLLYGAMRACALAAVVAAVARPERTSDVSVRRRRTLAVLLDASASMRLPVSGRSSASRRDELDSLLARHRLELEELARRYDLAVRLFGDGTSPAEVASPLRAPPPDSPATALGEALLRVFDETRARGLAGVLVFSDGASNLGTPPEAAAHELGGVPVHAIAIGDATALSDARVSALEAPPEATVGKPFGVAARVEWRLDRPARATLVLRVAGKDVERRELSLGAGEGVQDIRTNVTARAGGTLVLDAELSCPERDVAPWNDRRFAFVDVRERRSRILYIEGVLRRDYRAIRRALAGSSGTDLDVVRAFVRSEGGSGEFDGIRLEEYDAFVLGEVPGDVLPEGVPEALGRLVAERGRGLLVLAGPRALSGGFVASLLPAKIVEPGPAAPAAVRPLAAARGHPALRALEALPGTGPPWGALAPLGDRPAKVELRGGAEALLEADGVPVLVAGRSGAGRAAALLSGESFVWAEDPSAPRGLYASLARGLAAWVAGRETPREALSVSLARHAVWRGDTVSVLAQVNRARARELGLSDAEIDSLRLVARVEPAGTALAPLASSPPAGRSDAKESVRLERSGLEHTCSFAAALPGVRRLVVETESRDSRLAPAETFFVVEDDSREFARLEADPAALERLARSTGGLFARAEGAGLVLRELSGRPVEPAVTVRRRTSLWDRWGVLLACLACLSAEWWMRRR